MVATEHALSPEDVPEGIVLDAQALARIRTCRTCYGQGVKGVVLLRKEVEKSPDAPWVRAIPLGDAVKGDAISCLRYLVDEVKVLTLNTSNNGYTPLQLSVIWGKLDIMVYLLSRGGDPMLEGESSIVNMARLRQQRLQEALEQAGDGAEFEGFTITRSRMEPLIEEGREILHVLEGVEHFGSYSAWAENNANHPLVKRFSKDIMSSEPRYQLAALRELAMSGRASLLSAEKRKAMAEKEAAEEAARAREEQPLLDALVEADFAPDTAKEIRDALRTPTIKALRALRLSADDIDNQLEAPVRQRRMTEGAKRKFQRFVRELEEPPAATKAPAAAPKPVAKTKAKAAPAAKAALMALAKGAGRGAGAKTVQSKAPTKKGTSVDAVAVLFSEDLPSNAFMLVTHFMFGV